MKIEFKNKEELYERILPALTLRRKELKKEGFVVKEEEIWNFLSTNVYKYKENLTLADIVDEILKLDSVRLQEYLFKNKK